jgi:hypothetical protein
LGRQSEIYRTNVTKVDLEKIKKTDAPEYFPKWYRQFMKTKKVNKRDYPFC